MEQVSKAIKDYDVHKQDSERHLLVCKLFHVPLGGQVDETSIKLPIEDLVKRIEATNIAKSSP